MIIFRKQMQRTFAAKALSIFISLSFLLSSVAPGYAQTALTPSMPAPSTLIGLSGAYTPVLVRAIEIDPKDPLHFGFIVDNGDTKLKGDALTKETEKLIRYFLASMTVPENDMWVNLSPYEKDRIVPVAFGNTQMGRDLLAQDYILKQLSASLIYPEDNLGKKFWDKIYKKAYEKYGTTNIPVNTFNKVWIIPQKASVYESGNRVFVIDSELEVMMEEDFLALEKNTDVAPVKNEKQDIAQNKLASDIVREIILPEIKKEVNKGKNFANLRQIYNAMILATWYKKNLKESLLGKVYVDQNKIQGIELAEKNAKQKIYDQYVEAFKKGIYNFIKVEHDQYANKSIPRKYFSGGFSSLGSSTILRKETNPSPSALTQKGDVVNKFDIGLNETKSGASASAITIPDELPKFNNGRQAAEYLIKNGADPDWLMGFYPGFVGFNYAVPSTTSGTFEYMTTRESKRYIAYGGEVAFNHGWPKEGLPTDITIGDPQYAPPVIRLKLDEQTGIYKKISSSVIAVLPRVNPTQTEAWKALKQLGLKSNRGNYDLRKLFDQDTGRVQKFLKELSPEFEVDFSKNLINDETLKVLLSLAKETKLTESIELMFIGAKINETENRAVLHTALRNVKRDAQGKLIAANGPVFVDGKDVMPGVIAVLEKIEGFVKKVQTGEWRGASGKKIKNIINVGIGGSSLGPKMVVEALKPYKAGDIDAYFLSNIDGNAAAELMKKLDPEETLVYVVSKTFTTQETMRNAKTLRNWVVDHYKGDESVIAKHFVAVSTAKNLVSEFGINTDNMFEFWDWVGGRYSVWSAVGLSVATYVGFDNFLEFLQGGREADEHFRTQAFENNIPVLKGLLDVWYSNFLKAKSFAILPYDQNLSLFPEFSQQFFMESNGKYVDRNGKPVKYVTGLPRFGAAGTDGQHSFYQEIHQAPEGVLIPADFIGIINPQNFVSGHHQEFFSNFVAQTEALAFGLTKQEALEALKKDPKNQGADKEWLRILAQHKTFPGNRPTTSILIDQLTPRTLGNMVAMYEHEIFTEGIILNIFSFDQWGVQLGKIVATDKVLPSLMDQGNLENSGLSTSGQRAVQKFNDNFKTPEPGLTAGSAIVIPQVSSEENAWGLIKKVSVALEGEKKILEKFDLDSTNFLVGSRTRGDELMSLIDVAKKVVMYFKDGSSLTFQKDEGRGEWVVIASSGKDFESIEKIVVAPVASETAVEPGVPDVVIVAPEVISVTTEVQETPTIQSSVDIALIPSKTPAVDVLKEIGTAFEKIGKTSKIIFVGTNGFYLGNLSQGARLKLALKEAKEFKIVFADETSITVANDEESDRWKMTKVVGTGFNFVNKGALSDELLGIVKVFNIPADASEDIIKERIVADNMALGLTSADIKRVDYYEPGKKTPWGKELSGMPKNVKDPVVVEISVKDGFVVLSRAKNAKSFQFLEQHMPISQNFLTPFAEEEVSRTDNLLREAQKLYNLAEVDKEYMAQLWSQMLSEGSGAKEQLKIILDRDHPGKGENFILASMLSDKERKDIQGSFSYGPIAADPANIEAAQQADVTVNSLDGGVGEGVSRIDFLRAQARKAGLPEDAIASIKMAAKGTDLGHTITVEGQEVFISIAEAKIVQLIDMAKKKYYAGMKFQPLVNWQSKTSYIKLLDQTTYVFDRLSGNGQGLTYRQALEANGVKVLEMLEQADLPWVEKESQDIVLIPDTEHVRYRQPGGHGQWGFLFLWSDIINPVPKDGLHHIRVFYNGDNINSHANPSIVGFMIRNNFPIVKLTTKATRIDKKGGKDGAKLVMVEKKIVYVSAQMEKGDAVAGGQEKEFYSAGQKGGLGEEDSQPFNTNIFYINDSLVSEILGELKQLDEFKEVRNILKIISPTLIEKPYEQKLKNMGDERYFRALDGAIGTAMHNLNEFFLTTTNPKVKQILSSRGLDRILYFVDVPRTKFFTPVKDSFDMYLQTHSDYYRWNQEAFGLDDAQENSVPPEAILSAEGNYWKEYQNFVDAFGKLEVLQLESLSVNGKVKMRDARLIGKVNIVNHSKEELDLNKMLTMDKFPSLFENGPLAMTEDGRLVLDNVSILYDGSSLKVSKIDSGKSAGSAIVTVGEVKTKIDDLIGQLQGITKIELIRQHGEKITFRSIADFFETWDAQFSELEDIDMAQEFNRIVITLDGWADVNVLLPGDGKGFRVSRADFARFTADHSQADLNARALEVEKALSVSKDSSAKKTSSSISRSRYLGGWKHLESTFENGQTTHILWTDKFTKQAWKFVEDGNFVNDSAKNILARQEAETLVPPVDLQGLLSPVDRSFIGVPPPIMIGVSEDTDPQTAITGWTSPHGKSLEEILNAIIKEYDIRGYDGGDDVNYPAQMDDKLLRWIGRGLGSGEFYSAAHGRTVSLEPGDTFIIAGDNGPTTQKVNNALIEGLRDAGVNVVDLGTVPSGLLYFNIKALNAEGGLYVTRSHVEVGTNGAKPVIGGITLYGEMLQGMKVPILANLYRKAEKRGNLVKTNEIIAQAKKEYYAFLREEFGGLKATLDRMPMKIGVNFAGGSTAADPEVKKIFQELLGGHLVSVLRDQSDPWGKEGGLADSSRDDIKALAHPKANIIEYSMEHPDEVIFNFDLDADRVSIVWGGKLYLGDDMFLPVIEYQLTMAPDKEYYKEMFIDSRMKATVTDAVKSFGGISKKHPKGHSKVKASMDVALAMIAQKEGQSIEEFLKAHPKFRMLQPEYSLHMFSSNKFGASIDDAVRFAFIWLEIFSAIKEKYNKPDLTLAEYAQDLEGQGMIKPISQVKEQRTTINDAAKVPVMKRMAQKVKDYFSRHPEFKFESYSSWQDFQGSLADYVFVDIEGVYDFTTPLGHIFWGWSNTSPKIAYGVQADTVEKTRKLLEIVMSLLVQSRQETAAEMGIDLESISPVETSASQRLLNISREDLPKFEIKLKDQYPGDKLFEVLTASSGIKAQQSSSVLGEKIDNDRLNQGFVSDDDGYYAPAVMPSTISSAIAPVPFAKDVSLPVQPIIDAFTRYNRDETNVSAIVDGVSYDVRGFLDSQVLGKLNLAVGQTLILNVPFAKVSVTRLTSAVLIDATKFDKSVGQSITDKMTGAGIEACIRELAKAPAVLSAMGPKTKSRSVGFTGKQLESTYENNETVHILWGKKFRSQEWRFVESGYHVMDKVKDIVARGEASKSAKSPGALNAPASSSSMAGRTVFEKTRSLIQKTEWDVMDARNSILFIEKDRKLRWSYPNLFVRDSQTFVEHNAEDVVAVEVTLFKNDVGHTYRMELDKAGNQFVEISSGDNKNVSSSGVVTDQFVEQTVTDAVKGELGLDEREIKPSSRIRTDLGADIDDIVAIGVKIEKSFFANQVYVDSRKVDNVMGRITNTTTVQELCGFVKGAVSSAIVKTVNIPNDLNIVSLYNKFEDELAVAPHVAFMEKAENGFNMYGEGYKMPISALDRDLADGQRVVFKLSTNEIVDIERKGSEAEIIIRTNGPKDIDAKVVMDVTAIVEGKTLPIVRGKAQAQVASSGIAVNVPIKAIVDVPALIKMVAKVRDGEASEVRIGKEDPQEGLAHDPSVLAQKFKGRTLNNGQTIVIEISRLGNKVGETVEINRKGERIEIRVMDVDYKSDMYFRSEYRAFPVELDKAQKEIARELIKMLKESQFSGTVASSGLTTVSFPGELNILSLVEALQQKASIRFVHVYEKADGLLSKAYAAESFSSLNIPLLDGQKIKVDFMSGRSVEFIREAEAVKVAARKPIADSTFASSTEADPETEAMAAGVAEELANTSGKAGSAVASIEVPYSMEGKTLDSFIKDLSEKSAVRIFQDNSYLTVPGKQPQALKDLDAGNIFLRNGHALILRFFLASDNRDRMEFNVKFLEDKTIIAPVAGNNSARAAEIIAEVINSGFGGKAGSAISSDPVVEMQSATIERIKNALGQFAESAVGQGVQFSTVDIKVPGTDKSKSVSYSEFLEMKQLPAQIFPPVKPGYFRTGPDGYYTESVTISGKTKNGQTFSLEFEFSNGRGRGASLWIRFKGSEVPFEFKEELISALQIATFSVYAPQSVEFPSDKEFDILNFFNEYRAAENGVPERINMNGSIYNFGKYYYEEEKEKPVEELPKTLAIGESFDVAGSWSGLGASVTVTRLFGKLHVRAIALSHGGTSYWTDFDKDGMEKALKIIEKMKSSSSLGGISMDSANLNLQIKRDGNGIPLPVSQQPIEMMNIQGFSFTIMSITPVANLFLLSGLSDTGDSLSKKISEGIGQAMVADKRELSLNL